MNDLQHLVSPLVATPPLDLDRIALASAGDTLAVELEARQIEASRIVHALRSQAAVAGVDADAILTRCVSLLERAQRAAATRSFFVARDCLMQFERERIGLMSVDERRAATQVYLAQARRLHELWRHEAALMLASQGQSEAPGVAALQALLDVVHEGWRAQALLLQAQRQRLPLLVPLLLVSLLFFTAWALLGGFDWLARDDIDVTTAMLLVTGALVGWLGGLMSFTFNPIQAAGANVITDKRGQFWLALARPAIGAAMSVPLVLIVEAGLLDLAQLPAAVIVLLCFVAGIAGERIFVRRIARAPSGQQR